MSKEPKIHKSITEKMVLSAVELEMMTLDNPGICLACGNEQDGCEPDARNYTCEASGEKQVFGAAEFMISGYYHGEFKT